MIRILRAELTDASELLAVKVNSFSEEVKLYGFGPPGYDMIDNQIRAIETRLYFKIVDEEKIIGGMGVMDQGEEIYWLGSIYIDSEYQNRGIGTLAMNFLASQFPKAVKWSLETPYQSYRNHHFYEKLGFVKVGETKPESGKNGFRLFLYEKVC